MLQRIHTISRFLRAIAIISFPIAAVFTHDALAQQSIDSSAAPGVSRPTVPLTVEERLAKLEAEITTLRQENQQLRNQIGIVTAAAGSSASDSSAAPSAAESVKADEAQAEAKKAAEAAHAASTAAVAAAQKPAPKPDPGINISAITPPKSEPAPAATPALTPHESIIASVAPTPSIIKPAGSEQWLSVGGFVQFQGEAGDPIDSRFNSVTGITTKSKNDRLYLRRARIVLGGHFAEDFDFKVAAEMSGSLSETSAMRGQLADGYISWTRFPALNLTVGQFKTSYGFEFLSNDLTIYPIEHALVTDALTLGRQIGGQASGTFLKTRLNYTIGAFNGNGVNTNVNDNNSFLYLGRITIAPVKEHIPLINWDTIWTFGINGYQSKDNGIQLANYLPATDTFFGKRKGWGFDTQVLVGPWDIWGEYLETEYTPDLVNQPLQFMTKTTTTRGWYVQGSYAIVPKKWQLLLRYDVFDPDITLTGNETKTWTLGINYLIKGDDLKLMLNYMTSSPFYYIKSGDNKDSASNMQRFLLRLQAAF